MKFDLGWGNAVCVRKAFIKGLDCNFVFMPLNDRTMSYTAHDGDAKLVEITRRVIERQVGPTYKHIFLVNGASGGVTIALRSYKLARYKTCLTRKPPFFPIYPSMIEAAGMRHMYNIAPELCLQPVVLIDSPANPSGESIDNYFHTYPTPMIWDAVYHSKVYTNGNYKPLPCDILVGSYSKLLGLNGLRTGWVATNDDKVAQRLKTLVEAEYCGLSSASTEVLLTVLKDYKSKTWWENFEYNAHLYLDANRSEWARLERFFGGTPVYHSGMFYYAPMDKACKKLLEKSGITWTKGSSLHAEDDYGRINLGQDCDLVLEAVKTVLKNDKIRSRAP